MRATPEATERFADDADLAEVGYAALGRTGLRVSRLGFGSYRVDDRAPGHADALRAALDHGINLIDTAGNYADGHAELAVGSVLAERFGSGLSREQVVVVEKVGFVQGETLRQVREREAEGETFAEMVRPQDGLWFSIHPSWIEEELERSLGRLKLDSVDLLLLHNPETFLADAAQHRRGVPLDRVRDQLYRRVQRAFETLERLAGEGRIGWYGVSSNTLAAAAEDPQRVELGRLLEAAQAAAKAAGRSEHRFAAIELPLNLVESRAALGGDVLSKAKAAGVAVLANRPLNAILGPNRLLRLADPPPPPEAPPLAEAAAEVRAIEAVFVQDFAPKIRVESGPPAAQMFRWGHELADAPSRLFGIEQWMGMQAQVIGPQIQGLLQQLAQGFKADAAFQAWGKRYVEAINALLAAVSAALVEKLAAEAASMKGKLAGVVPERWRTAPLARQAIATALSTDGVTSVLVGMRRTSYVDDAIGAVGLPALDAAAARRAYEAFGK